jgi:hypothetical protein
MEHDRRMAKPKRGKGGKFTASSPTVRIVQAPAPRKRSAPRRAVAAKQTIVKVSAPKAPARRRRSSSGGGGFLSRAGGAIGTRPRVAIMTGALALGYAHKEKWLERIPLIGKAGPVTSFGLLGWAAEEFLHMKLPNIVRDMVTSSLAISAFTFGSTLGAGNVLVGEEHPGGAVFYG